MKATTTLLLQSRCHQISLAPLLPSLEGRWDNRVPFTSPTTLLMFAASQQPCLPVPVIPAQASPISPVHQSRLASDALGVRI